MDESFNKILFLTSFCCMAIDGEIAKEEYDLLKNFSDTEKLFGPINVDEEFQKCMNVLKTIGRDGQLLPASKRSLRPKPGCPYPHRQKQS